MASDRQSNVQAAIRQILAGLGHLNLRGSVEYDPKRPAARGGFGVVYRGLYKRPDGSNSRVAIKCLTVYLDGSRDTTKIFKREIEAWSKLKHPNVLPLLGYLLEDTGNETLVLPSLISEWMDNGNVLEFVNRNPGCNVARLALGMSEGLAYLHENNVVHADFKSLNVLVSAALEAVICDFGAAHAIRNLQSTGLSSIVSELRGTSRWLAYELLVDAENDPKPTKASDTWAYGMTLYEILTNGYPFADIQNEGQILLAIMEQRLPSPPSSLESKYRERLWHICTMCWACNPVQRPLMSEIVHHIRDIKEAALTTDTILSSTVDQRTLDEAESRKEGFAKALRSEFSFLKVHAPNLQQLPDYGRILDESCNYYFAKFRGKKIVVGRFHTCTFQERSGRRVMNVLRALSIPGLRQHPNIQTLLGYAWNDARPMPDLVYEYIDGQRLQIYLGRNPDANLVQMSLGIAEGIACIHDNDVIHGDINSNNILICAREQPIITAFYASCHLPYHGNHLSSSGTARFCAPETLIGDGVMTCAKAKDVWAFGMAVYVMISGELPYSAWRNEFQALFAIHQGQRPDCPLLYSTWSPSRKALWGICQKCWKIDPEERPLMQSIVISLRVIMDAQKYIDYLPQELQMQEQ